MSEDCNIDLLLLDERVVKDWVLNTVSNRKRRQNQHVIANKEICDTIQFFLFCACGKISNFDIASKAAVCLIVSSLIVTLIEGVIALAICLQNYFV